MVTVLRIVEREEALDDKFRATAAGAGMHEARMKHRPKELRKKLMAQLSKQIDAKFDDKFFEASVARFFNAFDQFYLQDLAVAQTELPSRFPQKYRIWDFFRDKYHDLLYTHLDRVQKDPNVEPDEIMTLLRWGPKYKELMRERLSVDTAQFKKQLLDSKEGSETQLREKYLRMLQEKLQTWSDNLLGQEIDPWMVVTGEDEEPFQPDQNREGLYYTDTPKILFSMIDSQVSVAFQPGNGDDFAQRLVNLCMRTLTKFAENLNKALDATIDMYFGPSADPERPPLLAEYMMTLGNNCQTTMAMVEQLRARLEAHFGGSSTLMLSFNGTLKLVIRAMTALGERAADFVVIIIYADIQGFMDELLDTRWMRANKGPATIVATVRDYGGDLTDHMHSTLVPSLMMQLHKKVVLGYVQRFVGRHHKCKTDKDREDMATKLTQEVQTLQGVFQPFLEQARAQGPHMVDPTKMVTVVLHLLDAPGSMLLAEWKRARSDFPDISLHHLEAILQVREDFTHAEIKKEILESIIKKTDDDLVPSKRLGRDFFCHIDVPTTTDFEKAAEKQGKGK